MDFELSFEGLRLRSFLVSEHCCPQASRAHRSTRRKKEETGEKYFEIIFAQYLITNNQSHYRRPQTPTQPPQPTEATHLLYVFSFFLLLEWFNGILSVSAQHLVFPPYRCNILPKKKNWAQPTKCNCRSQTPSPMLTENPQWLPPRQVEEREDRLVWNSLCIWKRCISHFSILSRFSHWDK